MTNAHIRQLKTKVSHVTTRHLVLNTSALVLQLNIELMAIVLRIL